MSCLLHLQKKNRISYVLLKLYLEGAVLGRTLYNFIIFVILAIKRRLDI